jgi:hypothetical protein
MLLPSGLTAILNVVDAVPKLHTLMVLTTAALPAGTVYSVLSLAAEGFDCPNTL